MLNFPLHEKVLQRKTKDEKIKQKTAALSLIHRQRRSRTSEDGNGSGAGRWESKHSPFDAVKSMATVKWIWVLKQMDGGEDAVNKRQAGKLGLMRLRCTLCFPSEWRCDTWHPNTVALTHPYGLCTAGCYQVVITQFSERERVNICLYGQTASPSIVLIFKHTYLRFYQIQLHCQKHKHVSEKQRINSWRHSHFSNRMSCRGWFNDWTGRGTEEKYDN